MRTLLVVLLLCATGAGAEEVPAPRWGHVLAYDPVRDELLLYGGASQRGAYLDDTWTWKDGTWTNHAGTAPAARGFAACCFDPSSNQVILHGGRGNDRVTFCGTWTWGGESWVCLQSEGEWRVDHHQVVWDDARRQLVGFGGWTGSGVADETRVWTGSTWTLVPVESPPPRASFGMAFDAERQRVVLYGGLWINGQYADTWFWDGTAWAAWTGPHDDSSLDHHSITWDAERKQLVLFGGKDYRYQPSGRTRSLTGKAWVEKSREGPSPRHSSPLAWHAGRKTVLLFGGKYYEADQQLPLGDLWEWDGASWREIE